ncbi:ATP-binding protein [Gracilibacillus caseinilyticus]|uniref:histidine kinase n=1 Tax=Gracilibacillus caseinilyticus TaxID=2932256 RepID=A0ABY4ESV8_9BACI|nr:sensor histidine kinase [Gracilibacillus caseinilyticus]UOQ47512.1 ATP-binding protein [Gracilibacillus caseinilyticus]
MITFFNNFSLRNKLLCILLVAIVIFSGFSLLLIQSIEKVSSVSNTIQNENIPEIVWYNQWEKELAIKKQIVLKSIENGFQNDFQQEFQQYSSSSESEELSQVLKTTEKAEGLHTELMLLEFIITNKVFGLLQYNDTEAAENVLQQEYLPALEDLSERLLAQRNEELNALQKNTNTYPEIIEQSLYFLIILTIIGILLAIYFSYRLSRSITNPIEKMVAKVDNISNGSYGETVTDFVQVEFKSLANSINRMSMRLQQSFHQIMSDKIKHEQILNSLPIGIITNDYNEKTYWVNSCARYLFEFDQDMISDRDLIEKQKQYPILNMLLSNKVVHNQKFQFTSRNEEYVLLASHTNLKDLDRQTTGKILYFVNITESEMLENQIVQSEKLALVGEMAASSAHEIRNPLTVIHGFLTLMKESMSNEEAEKYHFHLMMKEIDRLYSIVEQMLLMSNHKKPEKEMVLLSELLQELLPLMYSSLEAKNINLVTEIAEEYILADQKQLKQVFLNLLQNSKDAIGDNGTIIIESTLEFNQYVIYIRDTGSGIPDTIRQSLFEPFSTSKDSGTGLGLNVVRRIIENHNGSISIYKSDHNGTTFKMALPHVKQKSSVV